MAGDKLVIPKGRGVGVSSRVRAAGVRARFIGFAGAWRGVDAPCEVLAVADGTVTAAAEDGRQFRVHEGEGYFTDAEGPLPAGVPTGEPSPGAAGESDADRPDDHLHGTGPGQEGGVVAAPGGEPGDVAGVLPEVRPDLQGQPPEQRPGPEHRSESGNLGKGGDR